MMDVRHLLVPNKPLTGTGGVVRQFLGGAVLVLGTGALGLWASNDHAERMQANVRTSAQEAISGATHAVEARVEGRDITVSGLADTEAERDALLAALSDVDGRRVVRDELIVLPTAEPYQFGSRLENGEQVYRGNVPTEEDRIALGSVIGAAASQLDLASGAPDDWVAAVSAADSALAQTKSGVVDIANTQVTLDALVANPTQEEAVRAIIAALPDAYTADLTLDVEDDGTPLRLMAEKTAEGVTAEGKLPLGMSADAVAPLAVADTSAIAIARIPSPDGLFPGVVDQGVAGLALLEAGVLDINGRSLFLQGTATRANRAEIEQVLATVPQGFRARVDVAIYDDGEPMGLAAVKDADGVRLVDGKLPFGMSADTFGLPGGDTLEQAEIEAKAADFDAATDAGLRALNLLETGALSVDDATEAGGSAVVTLSGAASTPAVAEELETVLAGFSTPAEVALTFLDDGAPLSLSAVKGVDGIMATGKVPADLSLGDADATNLAVAGVASDADAPFSAAAEAGLAALGAFDAGTLEIAGDSVTLNGVANRAGRDQAEQTLSALTGDWAVSTDIAIADNGEPMRLTAGLSDGMISTSGKLPFGTDAAALGLDALSDDATVAEIEANAADFVAASAAGLSALGEFEAGTLDVLDAADAGGQATVRLAGVTSRAGEATARTALAGFDADFEITYADDGQPMTLTANASGITGGKLPFGATADQLGISDLGAARVAEVDAQDAGFMDMAARGLAALAFVDDGTLSVSDGAPATMTLSGTVDTPEDRNAVLAAFGDGANATIETRDDGTPPAFDLRYSATDGATVTGKLPLGLTRDALAEAMVLATVEGDVTEGLVGDAATMEPVIEALAAWLPELESATLSVDETGAATIDATAAPGVNVGVLRDALASDLDGLADLSLAGPEAVPASGTIRTNAATGVRERFSGFAWLPAYTFDPTLQRCNDETLAILERSRINFLTGSAQLDARSVRAVNALSGAVQHCLINDSRFRIEVGGHTDAQGDEDSNQALSEERASAVRDALIARGIGPGALTAVGYGETQPIADNETEEGRAQNRRTTFSWSRAN
ncbi:OmpA family protein [Shimia ponticola]|uniref:OmpA family protein n=1 Tax=Shimia ponticola TaxID=2582893 RepID=UPI0021044789|nr:OmpA family protein [Shimia ponticola]